MPGHRLCKAAAYELRRQMSQHGKAVIKAQHTHPEADQRFSLDNAGITLDSDLLSRALTTPITLGIVVGYIVGKPLGIGGTAWILTRMTRGRVRPPVGPAAVLGAGTAAAIDRSRKSEPHQSCVKTSERSEEGIERGMPRRLCRCGMLMRWPMSCP